MRTVVGILSDRDGLATTRGRSWASPSADYRSEQPDAIPIDREHDGRAVGRVLYLERSVDGDLWAVGEVHDHVSPTVNVWVGDELVSVDTPAYWSAERWGGEETGGLVLRSVALTPATARIAARPLAWFPGTLDHRHVAAERWGIPAGYLRGTHGAARELGAEKGGAFVATDVTAGARR